MITPSESIIFIFSPITPSISWTIFMALRLGNCISLTSAVNNDYNLSAHAAD